MSASNPRPLGVGHGGPQATVGPHLCGLPHQGPCGAETGKESPPPTKEEGGVLPGG